MPVSLEVKTTRTGLFAAQALGGVFKAPIDKAVRDATLDLQRRTMANFPVGATGDGRASIVATFRQVESNAIVTTGTVMSNLPYVRFVEEGTRPGKLRPIAPLRRWAQAVLGDPGAAWAVNQKIKKKGTRPQRPFERAKNEFEAPILADIRRAIVRVERQLSD